MQQRIPLDSARNARKEDNRLGGSCSNSTFGGLRSGFDGLTKTSDVR